MRRILVGGAWSASGKTSVVELLLRALPGWAAIKVTPSRPEEVCPIGACCGSCAPPEGPYEVILDPAILHQSGKDTDRYRAAGARSVAWMRGLPEALPAALEVAMAAMKGAEGILIESGTAIPMIEGLRVMVVRDTARRLKDSALACAGRIDVMAVNASDPLAWQGPHPMHDRLRPARVLPISAIQPPDAPGNFAFVSLCRELAG